jgi:hypothetical protein
MKTTEAVSKDSEREEAGSEREREESRERSGWGEWPQHEEQHLTGNAFRATAAATVPICASGMGRMPAASFRE